MDNQTLQKDGIPVRLNILDWVFGQPVLRYANNSTARWDRSTTSPLNQKGGTGWLACLHGGVQPAGGTCRPGEGRRVERLRVYQRHSRHVLLRGKHHRHGSNRGDTIHL